MNLQDLLLALAQFGEPKLFKMDRGWYCGLECFVTGQGVKFEIKSGYDHATPTDAVNECRDRLQAALAQIKTAAPAIGMAP